PGRAAGVEVAVPGDHLHLQELPAGEGEAEADGDVDGVLQARGVPGPGGGEEDVDPRREPPRQKELEKRAARVLDPGPLKEVGAEPYGDGDGHPGSLFEDQKFAGQLVVFLEG